MTRSWLVAVVLWMTVLGCNAVPVPDPGEGAGPPGDTFGEDAALDARVPDQAEPPDTEPGPDNVPDTAAGDAAARSPILLPGFVAAGGEMVSEWIRLRVTFAPFWLNSAQGSKNGKFVLRSVVRPVGRGR